MKKLKNNPQGLLLITGLLLPVMMFAGGDYAFDIHLHDTYFVFVFHHNVIIGALAVVSIIIWIIYILLNSLLLSKILSWLHVVITVLTLLLCVGSMYFVNDLFSPEPLRYFNYSDWKSFSGQRFSSLGIVMMIMLCGQLIFVVNLAGGIVTRIKKYAEKDR